MGDDDNGLPVFLHLAENNKKPVRLLRSKDCRRLIEDQGIDTAVKHLYDFDGLLLADRHLIDLLLGIDFKSVLLGNLLDLLVNGILVDQNFSGESEDDILGSREYINEFEMLMDHADS